MKKCPYCKEQVDEEAIKCRYCQSILLPGAIASPSEHKSTDTGSVTYIVDNGLVRFGKFVVAVLGIFILLGTYLFGIKLEVTVQKMTEAQRTLDKAEQEIEALRAKTSSVRKDVEQAQSDIDALIKQMQQNVTTSSTLLDNLRTRLSSRDETRLAQIRSNDPEKFRGGGEGDKILWPPGSTLRVRFLDGDPDKREKFRKAMATWLKYANLKVAYGDDKDSEIKVSFRDAGSWAYKGTEGLIVGSDNPSINLGYEIPGAEVPRNFLHELGHVLGLIHEYKNPQAKLNWNKEAAYASLSRAPNFWTKAQIEQTLFAPEPYPGARPFDPNSIMMMDLAPALFSDGKGYALPTTLSDSDKSYIKSLYP